MSVPRLRFPGFLGPWEEKRLEEVASVARGKFSARPRNDPQFFGGKTPFVQTGDVVSSDRYLTRYSQTLNKAGLAVSKVFPAETILITIAANIGDVAITAFPVACPDSLVGINADDNTSVGFLFAYLGTRKEELYSYATQNAQANINLQVLNPLRIPLPTLPEQKKIAAFLGVVDAKIAALRARVLGLQTYKRGLMQALFSQSLRFTKPDGTAFPDWEEKRLGEVAQKTASVVTAQSLEHDTGDFPVFGASGYIKGISFFASEVPHIAIVKDGAGVGRLKLCPEKSSVLGTLDSIIGKNGTGTIFLYHLLSLVNFQPFVTGSTIPHIYFRDYASLVFEIPHPDEQAKIAVALQAMDAKITAVQLQVDKMQDFKKGLLQQMFV